MYSQITLLNGHVFEKDLKIIFLFQIDYLLFYSNSVKNAFLYKKFSFELFHECVCALVYHTISQFKSIEK